MFYDSDSGRVAYEIVGAEDAPVLVFIHGVAMDKDTFQGQVEHFREDYRVLVFDLPGHGESYEIKEGLVFTDAVKILKGLLDHLGIDKAVLVGLSMGALVAQRFAALYPERTHALVDVGALPLHERLPRRFFVLAKTGIFLTRLLPEKLFFRLFAHDKAKAKKTRSYLYDCGLKTGKRAVLLHTKAMMSAMEEGIEEPPASPWLMMHGTKDARFLVRPSRRYAKEAENARQVMVNHAGHIANADEPVRFNDILGNFLKETL